MYTFNRGALLFVTFASFLFAIQFPFTFLLLRLRSMGVRCIKLPYEINTLCSMRYEHLIKDTKYSYLFRNGCIRTQVHKQPAYKARGLNKHLFIIHSNIFNLFNELFGDPA